MDQPLATGRVLLQPSLGGLPGHFQAASSPGELREHSHPGHLGGAPQRKADLIRELLTFPRHFSYKRV